MPISATYYGNVSQRRSYYKLLYALEYRLPITAPRKSDGYSGVATGDAGRECGVKSVVDIAAKDKLLPH